MPTITISRGTRSGGRAVAECLAHRLGYPCVGREILQEAAEAVGVSHDVLSEKFETPPGRWERLTQERRLYLLAVQTTLAEQCAQSDLVYHGLAGQFLLGGLPGVMRVRMIAPLEQRIAALKDADHRMSDKAAEDFIRCVDLDRRRWVKLLYDADVEDPQLYDLTLNMQCISLDTACVAIAKVAEQPHYHRTEQVAAKLKAFAVACREQLTAATAGRHS